MAKRVGLLLCLVLGILLALIIFEDSASAHKIVWKKTGGEEGGRFGCDHLSSGERSTNETSVTMNAAYQTFTSIFGTPNDVTATCYKNTDYCDDIQENWESSVCTSGDWACIAGYGDDECDHTEVTGTWAVIAVDSCGDGYCTGTETQCSCPSDCGISPTPCCVCSSTTDPCCDGCNFRPAGTTCGGTVTCSQPDYYSLNNATQECTKIDFPSSCQQICDNAGSCGNACCFIPALVAQSWSCQECKQKNLSSSCLGSTGPLCENLLYGTSCNDDGNICTNDICSSGTCTHPAKSYGTVCADEGNPCTNNICSSGNCTHPTFCAGTDSSCGCSLCSNCNLQDGYYDSGLTQWISTGECIEKQQKQQVYRDYYCSGTSCAYTSGTAQWVDTVNTRAKTGAPCTTALGYPGTCDNTGTCVPKPLLSVSAALAHLSINIGEQSTLSGTVTCSNANCGNIWVYAKNTSDTLINAISGLNVVGINPYPCSSMSVGDLCSPTWSITGLSPGNYPLYLVASNGSSFTNTSNTATLLVIQIAAGTISAGLSLDSSTVTVGTATVARGTVSCSGGAGAYCGNITGYLNYYGTYMGLSVAAPGPHICGELWNGQSCYVNWTLNSNSPGTYNITFTAVSDKPAAVSNAVAYRNLSVNSNPVGVLEIQNMYLNPPSQKIFIGENATIGAEIRCKSSDNSSQVSCGLVKSYARQNTNKITQSGPLSVANPEISCGIMNSTSNSICSAYWTIKGNSPGNYTLDIAADSGSTEVQNLTSATRILTVSKNFGTLSVTMAQFSPNEINITNPTILETTVNCSSYCGIVGVKPVINPSAGISGDLSQKNCYSFPCNQSWSMIGSSEGSFTATVTAISINESQSVPSASASAQLVVKGPNPLLGLVSNLVQIRNSNPRTGQPVQIRATVTCYTKGCGQTTVSLAYNSNGWKNLPYEKVQFTPYNQQNPVVFSDMPAWQSYEVIWTVNFIEQGTYEIGIFANGSAVNVINAVTTETITVTNVMGNIEIQSPVANSRFSRGDVISLKARITVDGKPATGLSPSVQQLGAALYDDGNHSDEFPNDGVYGGAGRIPLNAGGESYELTFRAGEYQASTYIYINPGLSVTVNTDKASYSGGDKIRITGEVKKNNIPAEAMVTLLLSHSSGSWSKETRLNATGSYSSEDITVPNIEGKITINVNAQDSYMNSGQNQKEVSVAARTGDFYNISFLLSKYNYSRGEKLSITVKVTDMDFPQAGVRVKCNFFGDFELDEGGTDGLYYASHAIPFDASIREESLACETFGAKNGTGFVNIRIEPMFLRISIIDPEPSRYRDTDVISAAPEEPVKLKVKVQYPDGSPVTEAVVQMMVGGDMTNMTQAEPGNYTADVRFTKMGSGIVMSTVFLTAQDSQGNQGKSNVGLVVGTGEFNWWWLLLIPAGLAILFVVYLYMKSKEEAPPPQIQIHEKIIKLPTVERVREVIYRPVRMPAKPRMDPVMRLKDEIDKLEEKAQTTQEAKDLAEQQYYKRQIDEATFNKLMQNYEEKLIELDATIRQKKKELYEMEPE